MQEASEEEIQKGVRIDSSKYLNDALTMFVKEECSYLIVAEGNRVKGKLPIEYLKQMMKE